MRTCIYLLLSAVLLSSGCSRRGENADLEQALISLSIDEFMEHLGVLSADDMMGRNTGTPGYEAASAYLQQKIEVLGLKPAGLDGDYRQPITFKSSTVNAGTASLSLNGSPLKENTDFALVPLNSRDSILIKAGVAFAGLGIEAPELNYNDFEEVDVSGKIVMIVREVPREFGLEARAIFTKTETSNEVLLEKGALAVIRIYPQSYEKVMSWEVLLSRIHQPKFSYVQDRDNKEELPQVALNHKKAQEIFTQIGKNYQDVLNKLTQGKPVSFDMGIEMELKAVFSHHMRQSHNLAAVLEGSDQTLKKEHLVMTAHLDHIGVSKTQTGDSINNGTLDNASGSVALLMMAQAFRKMTPKRSILFLWVTGEEKGLLGSEYFAKNPTIDAASIVANQNMDGIIGMIMETSDMIVYGYQHSNLAQAADLAVENLGLTISEDPTPELNIFVRSDQYSFVKEGYPAIWLVSGRSAADDNIRGQQRFDEWLATRYHQPSDDMSQPMDQKGIEQELKANFLMAYHIVNTLDSIAWRQDSFLYRRFAK